MTKLPRLYRRKRDGKEFGAWYVDVKAKPVNLRTNKRPVADKRRREAVRGVRQWPRDWDAAADPIRNANEGTVDSNLAALGDVAHDLNPGEHSSPGGGGAYSPPPPPDMGSEIPVVEPEPLPPPPREDAGAWAADLNAPAAEQPAADAPPPMFRLQDLPWFKGALVTISKAAVGLQLNAQAWVMKLVGDVEAGRVGPPPTVKALDGEAETMSAFMKAAGAPWAEDDPREPGRQSYERTIVALIPEQITVPAWVQWLEAPIVTGYNTIPVQWSTGKKIKRDANGKEVPAAPEPAATEAPPGERAAA